MQSREVNAVLLECKSRLQLLCSWITYVGCWGQHGGNISLSPLPTAPIVAAVVIIVGHTLRSTKLLADLVEFTMVDVQEMGPIHG